MLSVLGGGSVVVDSFCPHWLVESLFCYAILCVLSCFAIISLVKRVLVALLLYLFPTVCREMVCSV